MSPPLNAAELSDAGRDSAHADAFRNEGELPAGLDGWLVDWIRETRTETDLLLLNGAAAQAKARSRLLGQFVASAREWLESEVGIVEAAATMGRCEETIRRAVRSGALPDRRMDGRGHHRVRRGDLARLRGAYDPVSDAVRLMGRKGSR